MRKLKKAEKEMIEKELGYHALKFIEYIEEALSTRKVIAKCRREGAKPKSKCNVFNVYPGKKEFN